MTRQFVSHAYINKTVFYLFAEDGALVMYRDGGDADRETLTRVGEFDSLTACGEYLKGVAA